ncbi:Homeobox_KN domain-containing protein/POX domain-containing protein [Cephalotus follicularis]|uniref:Homeobox_KN domain-containing protein/POX domain-containing protein n=1 Tax=Cephalotus follicularis TaxID=3775 RepID=A0A1Q3AXF8_CEPFO|nr:Homeobox_KN domain-containing protein/POX domain-containing protein [Cephalotus follicularis]
MATYFSNLSYQHDDLSASYPGDQKVASCPETRFHPNNTVMYPNEASSTGSYSKILSRSTLPSHNCDEMPYSEGRNEMAFIRPTSDTLSFQSIDGGSNTATGNVMGDLQVIPRTQPDILDGEHNFQVQGLSLSLRTQMASEVSVPSFQYQYPNMVFSSLSSTHLQVSDERMSAYEGVEGNLIKKLRNSEYLPPGFTVGNNISIQTKICATFTSTGQKEMHSDSYYVPPGYANTLLNSKYLKAAQQLLDEVINVWKALKQPDSNNHQRSNVIGLDDSKETDGSGRSSEPSESITNFSSELSTAERQDLQNRKSKLLTLVDEVNRRHKHYCYQVQVLVSSFDMVAGCGAAKPYTALALQTISRQFCCLRDTISGQIRVTQRSLGEHDTSPNEQAGGIPRLRYVEHQLRQQRVLQQLGVMRQAWRPQRGLPETSVSILRAWLFEHFLHPYPKDSEKIMLARQTGLTKNQVANWFINARVRLWKPMVEEMYKEEFGDLEVYSKSSLDNDHKAQRGNSSASENRGEELQDTITSTTAYSVQPGQVNDLKIDHIPDLKMKRLTAKSVFQNGSLKDNIADSDDLKLQVHKEPGLEDHNLYPDPMISPNRDGHGNFMDMADTYGMSELSGFAVGSQVSLALGLRHCESDVFPISTGNHVIGHDAADSPVGPDTVDYHCMDPVNQQERFGNAHLIHDLVV